MLITGGAKRLGRSAAMGLAQAGADVAITYLSSQEKSSLLSKKIKKTGARVWAIHCDVSDPKSVSAAVKKTVAELGASISW